MTDWAGCHGKNGKFQRSAKGNWYISQWLLPNSLKLLPVHSCLAYVPYRYAYIHTHIDT